MISAIKWKSRECSESGTKHSTTSKLCWSRSLLSIVSLSQYTNKSRKSPAQRLSGRRRKTLLPISENLLNPETERNTQRKLMLRKKREKFCYDRGAKDLKELKPGDVVRIKIQDKAKEWAKATVLNILHPRPYTARTEEGM